MNVSKMNVVNECVHWNSTYVHEYGKNNKIVGMDKLMY
jgi:hypothetical protein